MRQRTINWNGAMRDMRRHRSPEQMLIREMNDVLKAFVSGWRNSGGEMIDLLDEAAEKARAVIAKAEEHTNV